MIRSERMLASVCSEDAHLDGKQRASSNRMRSEWPIVLKSAGCGEIYLKEISLSPEPPDSL